MTSEVRYFAADAEYQAELTRRRIGEAECDPLTVRYLQRIRLGDGWRCLEVGAGAGSIVGWLSDRVGHNGSVVAADIDTTDGHVEALQLAGAAERLRKSAGRPASAAERVAMERWLRPVYAGLSDEAATGAWQAGQEVVPEQALRFVSDSLAEAVPAGEAATARPRSTGVS